MASDDFLPNQNITNLEISTLFWPKIPAFDPTLPPTKRNTRPSQSPPKIALYSKSSNKLYTPTTARSPKARPPEVTIPRRVPYFLPVSSPTSSCHGINIDSNVVCCRRCPLTTPCWLFLLRGFCARMRVSAGCLPCSGAWLSRYR